MNTSNSVDEQSSERQMNWVVRRGRIQDLQSVQTISESTSTAASWSRDDYRSYVVADPDEPRMMAKALFVACGNDRLDIVGFAAFQVILTTGECGLENMAVREDWRRRGVGRRLLSAGLLWCRGWRSAKNNPGESEDIWLEVRASNLAAISFYRQAGFEEAGRRDAYYSRPQEDALVMRKKL